MSDEEKIPNEKGKVTPSEEFFEKVRQLSGVRKNGPEIYKKYIADIKDWVAGEGDPAARERGYKGWTDEELKELLITLDKKSDADFEKNQSEPRRQEALDPLFIDFEKYKKLGGEMSAKEYTDTQKWAYGSKDMERAIKKIASLRMGLPDLKFVQVFSKIDAQFPDKNIHWKMPETYLCLGKM